MVNIMTKTVGAAGVRQWAASVLNNVFGWLYEIHLASHRFKEWNRTIYYALKYTLTVALVGLIVASAFR